MSQPTSQPNDVDPQLAGGSTPGRGNLFTPRDSGVRRRLPTPPTPISRVNPRMSLDEFRARLSQLRLPGSAGVGGRPMRGALGALGIARRQIPLLDLHSDAQRTVGLWSERAVIARRQRNFASFPTANFLQRSIL